MSSSPTTNDRYVDRYCNLLAAHIAANPEVLEQAAEELDQTAPNANVALWWQLLAGGPPVVVAVLTSRDPALSGLKADNPFARLGLIDETTRLSLIDHDELN